MSALTTSETSELNGVLRNITKELVVYDNDDLVSELLKIICSKHSRFYDTVFHGRLGDGVSRFYVVN